MNYENKLKSQMGIMPEDENDEKVKEFFNKTKTVGSPSKKDKDEMSNYINGKRIKESIGKWDILPAKEIKEEDKPTKLPNNLISFAGMKTEKKEEPIVNDSSMYRKQFKQGVLNSINTAPKGEM